MRSESRKKWKAALGVLAALCFLFIGSFALSKLTENSSAVSSVEKNESTSRKVEEINEASSSSQVSIQYVTKEELKEKDLAPREEKKQRDGYGDRLDTFLRASRDTKLYSRDSLKANEICGIAKGAYLETYGHKDGWTKVTLRDQKGYVRDKDLQVVSDPSKFKVVDGHVIVNKKYGLDTEYETVFNEETASALRVMLEAMERDDIHLEVACKYRSAADEAKELVLRGQPANAPEPGHAVFQTGYGVQFYVKGTDPRLDNHFEETPQYAWLMKHAHEYGFILRYPEKSETITGYRADPTIFYYVGMEDASIMRNEGLTMEVFYGLQ